MTGEVDRSDSLDRLLSALLESFASTIAERWFRLSYRQYWVIAAVTQKEERKSILLAVDRGQKVVGADHVARQMLAASGRSMQADCTLSIFFQVNGAAIYEKRYADAAMTLPARVQGDPWSVLITPPEFGINSAMGEASILHARPRLDSISRAGGPGLQDDYQSGLSRKALRRVEEYIDTHLDSSLDIEVLAACVGISVSHFSRSFFRSSGLTPHTYVMRRRLARAQDLLVKTDLALAEVALTTGFADQSHFCRRFREFVGLPPRSYRMQYR
jgi:transcriptional regulator GlxA family with amidase domain